MAAQSLRCPRCSNVVTVEAGQSPVCPRCGFGGPVAPTAPLSTPFSAPVGTASPQLSPPPAFSAPYAGMQQRNDGMAVAALVLGLCGFIPWLGFVCSILAVIFGFVSLGNIKKNPNLKGHGMAVAGIVLGFALPVLGIIVFVVVFALASRLAHGV